MCTIEYFVLVNFRGRASSTTGGCMVVGCWTVTGPSGIRAEQSKYASKKSAI